MSEAGLRSQRSLRRLPLTPYIGGIVWMASKSVIMIGIAYCSTMNLALLLKQMTIVSVSTICRCHTAAGMVFMARHLGTIFKQDNVLTHTTRISLDCLRAGNMLPWPTRSPDHSPIEHI
ncbi:hypothetical protein TNCV_4500601 [Trichonephila clavipes]|nr:hypothetical protein TNCV_4500601 [Trichonephila clavipes]